MAWQTSLRSVTRTPERRIRPCLESLEDRTLLDATSYVVGLYETLLNRTPSPAEAIPAILFVGDGTDDARREQLVQIFVNSDEYLFNLVNTKYQNYLERPLDPMAMQVLFPLLRNGFNELDIDTILLSSDEFFQRNGGNLTDYVQAAFQTTLDRPIDPASLNFVVTALQSGLTRQDFADLLVYSEENLLQEVNNAIFQFLGGMIPVGLGGLTNLDDLDDLDDLQEVVDNLEESGFLGVVTPEDSEDLQDALEDLVDDLEDVAEDLRDGDVTLTQVLANVLSSDAVALLFDLDV